MPLTQNKKVFFVTNNATKSRATNAAKLTAMGINATQAEMYTSSFAAAAYLKAISFNKKVRAASGCRVAGTPWRRHGLSCVRAVLLGAGVLTCAWRPLMGWPRDRRGPVMLTQPVLFACYSFEILVEYVNMSTRPPVAWALQAYVIGEEGLVEELTAVGVQCVGGPAHRGVEVDWSQAEPHVEVDPEVRACVVARAWFGARRV